MNKVITIIYKNYENDTFNVKTLGNMGKAIAFTLRCDIDRYLFLSDGKVIAGESWNDHDFRMFKVGNGVVLQVGYNDFDYIETIQYLYTNTGNLYKLEGGEKYLETLDGVKQQYSFYSRGAINNFLKEKYKKDISNYYIMSHECIYTDSYLYECGHYTEEDEVYYDKIYYSKSGKSSKCLQTLLIEDGVSAGSEDYFNLAEAIKLFSERKTETEEVSKTHERYGLCFGCLNARNTRIKTWYHGLQAFNKTKDKSVNGSIERVIDIMSNNKWDICVSSDPIGPIGLMYKGNVDRYYDHDTWSYLDTNGNRIPGRENENSDHDEGILNSAKKPVNLWVKSWYWESLNPADRSELLQFSDELNLKIVTLPSRK